MITKYGYGFVLGFLCFGIGAIAAALLFVDNPVLRAGLILLVGTLTLFIIYFFRDPDRDIPSGDHLILSPADGKVVQLKNVRDDIFLQSEATQISIFLSALDVHVNRIPITGKVRYLNYVKGKYLVACYEKASEKNEQTVIGIENGKFKILLRQIAGFLARRIVCDLKVDDEVRAGERFGMIKFGSRVDVLIPLNAELKVQLGDRVVGGETILAIVPS